MNFQVVYSEQQVSDPGHDPVHGIISPSAGKPRRVAAELVKSYPDLEFVPPVALDREEFYLCHEKQYVDDVFDKKRPNGFGTMSDSVNESLPYTNGAMWKAGEIAKADCPAAALVSGFHHAGYSEFTKFGYFCTFNGLMISALSLIRLGHVERVAIIDCDMHYGNGTQDIINTLGCQDQVYHRAFGRHYNGHWQAAPYLKDLSPEGVVASSLERFRPGLILYQSGADVHINDPMGGVLDEEEMMERDRRMFSIAKRLEIPLAWCLAGGYQVDEDGDIGTVLRLHLNTFRACEEIFGG